MLGSDGGGGSTAVPERVSGTESQRSELAASPGADELQTWTHPETRTGAYHEKDHLYSNKCSNHLTERTIECKAPQKYNSYQRAAVEAPHCQLGSVPG